MNRPHWIAILALVAACGTDKASTGPGTTLAGPEYTLPKRAWVRLDALAKGGPIDVSFEADFGERGHAEGRVRVATTEENVRVIPAPPPPP